MTKLAADADESLEILIATQEIRDQLSLYCEHLDRGNITAAAEVFTDDCVTDYGPERGGATDGRVGFIERVRMTHAKYSQTFHLLGYVRVFMDGDRAHSVAYLSASHRLHDGEREDPRAIYSDDWVHTDAGWQICRRVVQRFGR